MSKRSKRRRRQEEGSSSSSSKSHGRPALGQQKARAATKGKWLLVIAAALVIGGISYALGGKAARKDTTIASTAEKGPRLATSSAGLAPATSPTVPIAGGSGPRIAFDTPIYDFGEVKSGETVKHTYVFTNVGSAMLQLSNVQASCGCTTAGEWTKQVEPGKTGTIPIQFNSGGFGGTVGKTITVTCNDTSQPNVILQINGKVWKPIDVVPQFAVLNLTASAPSNATTVRIVNNEPAPLILSMPECANQAFAAELRTNQPGKEFEVVIRTVSPLSASVQGQVTLKTSSTNMPVINVTAWANVQQEIMVAPSQIMLSTAPLVSAMSSAITIQNNGTNSLAVSEAMVNDEKVKLELKEVQPGRLFVLTANFPQGFEAEEGKKLEVTAKSSHPKFPILRVPVVQQTRPAVSSVPQGAHVIPISAGQLPVRKP